MRILDAYIYKKLSVYLFIIFPSFSIISALIELIEILKKAKTIEFSTLTLYILTKLPENAYYIIPISLIVASFMFINDLIKSREIYPIILNGISLNYISIRIILFSILVVVLQVINLETVMPKTNQDISNFIFKVKKSARR
jgi:Predicted permeases